MVRPLMDKCQWVGVLSYVGSTTSTRIGADRDIYELQRLVPGLHGYLCFRRDERASPGSKGGFIQSLGMEEVHFYDDGKDHVDSGTAAGANAVLVSKNRGQGRKQVAEAIHRL